ncbi:TPA: hypothetical protein SMP92_002088 [Pseudomonas putida]|nr:hypothetical protein [Pseudomonas putida]
MNLPPIDNRPGEWPPTVIEGWVRLVEKANRMKAKVGGSDAFERMLARFRDMASSGRFDGLKELLGRRLGARALTWLWLHDEVVGFRLFNARMLDALIEHQQPRLSRLTLIQLLQLYFRYFDRLDERDKQAESSLRGRLELHLLDQLQRIPAPRQVFGVDPLVNLNREGEWLLTLDGPTALVKSVRSKGGELGEAFEALGLSGFDVGRYGDICRAHYYLDVLSQLPPGEWDDVLDELLKPSVSKAPYEGEKRIGHAALEIMIDRAGDDPGDAWQNFFLTLAGDPRIASSAPNFREWWKPLGDERIAKVCGWLSKEDLRLFLQAVEQYGVESGKEDLKRMFPARKLFLEGLFRLGLIRHTRLMLGRSAKASVKRILGGDVKTSFASMDSVMNDKAVIYLDCGDFHLVEGSHSFKIWVYLAQPGDWIKSYERNQFSHSDLTISLPGQYRAAYPNLPYESVTHNGSWQRKVFDFLAANGIALDIEKLLSRAEYKSYLIRYGMPVVGLKTARTEPLAQHGVRSDSAPAAEPATRAALLARRLVASRVVSEVADADAAIGQLGVFELQVLWYFKENPGDKVRYAANVLGVDAREINRVLYGPLKSFCEQGSGFSWSLKEEISSVLDRQATEK